MLLIAVTVEPSPLFTVVVRDVIGIGKRSCIVVSRRKRGLDKDGRRIIVHVRRGAQSLI